MAVELAIIIVNWNGGDLLRRCLASVAAHPPSLAYEIIVVDNASTDGSREWLANLGERVRLLANTENVGFGRANNQAFAATSAPLLFLLNSDAEVYAGAIDTLVATVKADARIGAAGPRLVNPDGSLQPSVWRNPMNAAEMLAVAFRLYRVLPKRLRGEWLLGFHWDHAHRRRANMLSGAALLCRRAMIDAVGGFDERFHMYGEDTEWCLRIVRGGWWLLFEPAATVLHHGGQSSAKRWNNLEKMRVVYQGFFRFQRLRLSRAHALANLVAGCFIAAVQHPYRVLRGGEAAETRLMLELYATELRQNLWGDRAIVERSAHGER